MPGICVQESELLGLAAVSFELVALSILQRSQTSAISNEATLDGQITAPQFFQNFTKKRVLFSFLRSLCFSGFFGERP